MRHEPACQENAAEESQTEGIVEYQAWNVANGGHKSANQSPTERIECCKKFRFEIYVFWLLWFQTITGRSSVRNRVSKNVTNLGNPEPQIRETDGDQTIFWRLILETDEGTSRNWWRPTYSLSQRCWLACSAMINLLPLLPGNPQRTI